MAIECPERPIDVIGVLPLRLRTTVLTVEENIFKLTLSIVSFVYIKERFGDH